MLSEPVEFELVEVSELVEDRKQAGNRKTYETTARPETQTPTNKVYALNLL
jgi:hypothetical protein